jgi:hypothetical protein
MEGEEGRKCRGIGTEVLPGGESKLPGYGKIFLLAVKTKIYVHD